MSRIGEECSIAAATLGSLLKVAVRAETGPSPELNHTISQGRTPLTTKTAITIPQSRNHLLALLPIVESTSALITALSMLETTSNKTSPKTTRIIDAISIHVILANSSVRKKLDIK